MVEVREIVIRATINQDESQSKSSRQEATGDNDVAPTDALVNTCIEKILEILKEKNGR